MRRNLQIKQLQYRNIMAVEKTQTQDTGKPDQALITANQKRLEARPMTAGELIFDRTVYTGIGFGLNEIISVMFAVMFEHGKGKYFGKQGFEKTSEWIAKTFNFKDSVKNGKHVSAKASAGNSLLWVSLTSGGFILLLPMKWMEDHKEQWVRRINHWVDKLTGYRLTEEQIATRDADIAQTIACEPKQTWKSLLIGRFIAIGASIGLGTSLGEARSEKIKQVSDRLLTDTAKNVGMGGLTQANNFHHYTRVIGVETVSCATSSIVLEIASKFFAKKQVTVNDPVLCARKMDPVSLKSAPVKKRAELHTEQVIMDDQQPVQKGI